MGQLRKFQTLVPPAFNHLLFTGLNVLPQKRHDIFGGSAGQENFRHSFTLQFRDVFLWNNATQQDETIIHALFAQQLHDARAERVSGPRLRLKRQQHQHPPERCGSDHFRSLSQTGVDDFHAGIAQGASNYFGAAIMAIQSRFGHQHPNSFSFMSGILA